MADDLTDDEFTVLLIAEQGESMMPIGRWEKSVESLVQKGFLQRHDKFNNTITEKGREAVKLRDAKDSHDLLAAMNKAVIAAKSEPAMLDVTKLETAAKALFVFANWVDSHGSPRELVLRKASEVVLKRALEFL